MRTHPWRLGIAVLVFGLPLVAPCTLPAQEKKDEAGWTALFDGKSLDGWKFYFGKGQTENRGTYRVEDGVLVCTGKPAGYMLTPKTYSRYTIAFELAFRRPEGLAKDADFGGNSGCLIHVGQPEALGVWPRSIEVQGMNREMGLILPIPRDVKCKRTFDKETLEKIRKPVGQFNDVVIDVDRGEMTIRINGEVISTVSDCELTEGAIGFQSEGAETLWKNIRIREKK